MFEPIDDLEIAINILQLIDINVRKDGAKPDGRQRDQAKDIGGKPAG